MFGEATKQMAIREGYTLTISGRKRYYDVPERPQYSNDNEAYMTELKMWKAKVGSVERQAGNAPIQGTNADITKLAMVWVTKAIKPYGGKLVLTIHDEVLITCPKENAEICSKLVREEMLAAEREFLTRVESAVEGGYSQYWGH